MSAGMPCGPGRPRHARQGGQALAEAAVVLGTLTALMWAVHATGTWQDDAMRAGLSARQAAFAYTRFATDIGERGEPGFEVSMVGALPRGLPDEAQPGGTHRHAVALRREWAVTEREVMAAESSRQVVFPDLAGGYLVLSRHTAVLRDAGHAAGDAQSQQRTGRSALAWRGPADASASAGRAVAGRLNPIDGPWSRPGPGFDWLSDWTAAVPPEYLREGGRLP